MGIAHQVVGLCFGDEGKGSIVDYLVRQYHASLVVRFNGGAQAAHRVVLSDGREHVFSQFGAGTLAGASTFLSKHVYVNPVFMNNEAEHLSELGIADVLSTVSVDPQALVTTPYHVSANRLRAEVLAHGSCGMGIGETAEYALKHSSEALRVDDLKDRSVVREKLDLIRSRLMFYAFEKEHAHPDVQMFNDAHLIERCCDVYGEWLNRVHVRDVGVVADALKIGDVVFEGAQGVLLDEDYGFHPHTTWSKCTFRNADHILDELDLSGNRLRIGVARAYATRHGAGPMPTAGSVDLADACNVAGGFQGDFRTGWLDAVLLNYAMRACGGLDTVAVTCLDRVPELSFPWMCTTYKGSSDIPLFVDDSERFNFITKAVPVYEAVTEDLDLLHAVSRATKAPISIVSRGPRAEDKVML